MTTWDPTLAAHDERIARALVTPMVDALRRHDDGAAPRDLLRELKVQRRVSYGVTYAVAFRACELAVEAGLATRAGLRFVAAPAQSGEVGSDE